MLKLIVIEDNSGFDNFCLVEVVYLWGLDDDGCCCQLFFGLIIMIMIVLIIICDSFITIGDDFTFVTIVMVFVVLIFITFMITMLIQYDFSLWAFLFMMIILSYFVTHHQLLRIVHLWVDSLLKLWMVLLNLHIIGIVSIPI